MTSESGVEQARRQVARLGLRFPFTPEEFRDALEVDAWNHDQPCTIIFKPDPMPEPGVVYGMCTPSGTTYIIHYRNDGSREQQRHILFHELGHIALGHVSTADVAQQDVPAPRAFFMDTAQEAEAEAFAAAMTKLSVLGDPDAEELSRSDHPGGDRLELSTLSRIRARIATFHRSVRL